MDKTAIFIELGRNHEFQLLSLRWLQSNLTVEDYHIYLHLSAPKETSVDHTNQYEELFPGKVNFSSSYAESFGALINKTVKTAYSDQCIYFCIHPVCYFLNEEWLPTLASTHFEIGDSCAGLSIASVFDSLDYVAVQHTANNKQYTRHLLQDEVGSLHNFLFTTVQDLIDLPFDESGSIQGYEIDDWTMAMRICNGRNSYYLRESIAIPVTADGIPERMATEQSRDNLMKQIEEYARAANNT